MVDASGNVIGVTTAKILKAEAIGFAIPIDIVKTVIPDLKRMGHAFRPQLGFQGTSVDPDFAKLFGLPVEWGVLVQSVEPGSIAEKLGLKAGKRRVFLGGQEIVLGGDLLVGIDDAPLHGAGDLTPRLIQARPGQRMVFWVVGPGGTRRVDVTLPPMRH